MKLLFTETVISLLDGGLKEDADTLMKDACITALGVGLLSAAVIIGATRPSGYRWPEEPQDMESF